MANVFQYVGEMSGGRHPMIVKIPVGLPMDVPKGTPLFYDDSIGEIMHFGDKQIGVTAADYRVIPDELDPNAGTYEALINISPDSIYKIQACTLTVHSCSGNTLNIIAQTCPGALDYCEKFKLVLASKSANSTNPNAIGSVLQVTSASCSGTTLSLTCSTAPGACAGDTYYVFPTFGFNYLSNSYDPVLDLSEAGGYKVLTTDMDEKTYTVKLSNMLL